MYDKFLKQLGCNSEGYYETNLIWKEIHSLLSDKNYGIIGRLNKLVKNLRRTNKLEVYDSIIQEQRANEIIEKVKVEEVNETVSERVFYLPHGPVISLETGPPLQNRLWDIRR